MFYFLFNNRQSMISHNRMTMDKHTLCLRQGSYVLYGTSLILYHISKMDQAPPEDKYLVKHILYLSCYIGKTLTEVCYVSLQSRIFDILSKL